MRQFKAVDDRYHLELEVDELRVLYASIIGRVLVLDKQHPRRGPEIELLRDMEVAVSGLLTTPREEWA